VAFIIWDTIFLKCCPIQFSSIKKDCQSIYCTFFFNIISLLISLLQFPPLFSHFLIIKLLFFSFAKVTEDGRYLIVKVYRGSERKNLLYFYDLSCGVKSTIPLTPIVNEFEASYDVMFINRIWCNVVTICRTGYQQWWNNVYCTD